MEISGAGIVVLLIFGVVVYLFFTKVKGPGEECHGDCDEGGEGFPWIMLIIFVVLYFIFRR